MPGSHADDILGDYFDDDDWAGVGEVDAEPEPRLPPLPLPDADESAA
jgi:hypothetical protein